MATTYRHECPKKCGAYISSAPEPESKWADDRDEWWDNWLKDIEDFETTHHCEEE